MRTAPSLCIDTIIMPIYALVLIYFLECKFIAVELLNARRNRNTSTNRKAQVGWRIDDNNRLLEPAHGIPRGRRMVGSVHTIVITCLQNVYIPM